MRRLAIHSMMAIRLSSAPREPVSNRPMPPSTATARAHAELIRYLRPLGASARWQEGALNVAAAVMLGLLLVGAIAVWIMVRRGLV